MTTGHAGPPVGPIGPDYQFGRHRFEDIACVDPRLGLALERSRGDGFEVIPVRGRWTSGALGTVVTVAPSSIFPSDYWIFDIDYTVETPNAFPGSVLRAQAAWFNQQIPYIHIQLMINSYKRYVISDEFIPVQLIRHHFNECCPLGVKLCCGATVKGTAINTRVFAAPGEIPTELTIGLQAVRLYCPYAYRDINIREAVQHFKRRGFAVGEPEDYPEDASDRED